MMMIAEAVAVVETWVDGSEIMKGTVKHQNADGKTVVAEAAVEVVHAMMMMNAEAETADGIHAKRMMIAVDVAARAGADGSVIMKDTLKQRNAAGKAVVAEAEGAPHVMTMTMTAEAEVADVHHAMTMTTAEEAVEVRVEDQVDQVQVKDADGLATHEDMPKQQNADGKVVKKETADVADAVDAHVMMTMMTAGAEAVVEIAEAVAEEAAAAEMAEVGSVIHADMLKLLNADGKTANNYSAQLLFS